MIADVVVVVVVAGVVEVVQLCSAVDTTGSGPMSVSYHFVILSILMV
jgi:hypothetical protein